MPLQLALAVRVAQRKQQTTPTAIMVQVVAQHRSVQLLLHFLGAAAAADAL